MPDRTVPNEITLFREEIKRCLPRLYDIYWSICDAGLYWSFPLTGTPLRRVRPRNALLRSGTRTVRLAYDDFIETAAMALAADGLASEQKLETLRNYWRFHFRNRVAADALRHFFRFLDQTSHHLFEVSDRQLLPNTHPRGASFRGLRNAVEKGCVRGSRRLRAGATRFIRIATESFTSEGWKVLQTFRNIDTHRYVVGIDHISYTVSRDDGQERVSPGGRLMTIGDRSGGTTSYSWYGLPDIDFTTIEQIMKTSMVNAKASMEFLSKARLLVHDRDT